MMDPVSPLPALLITLFALATTWIVARIKNFRVKETRYSSIDGLRGYLALFVFLHHSCVWYFYLRTGRWDVPPSNLYTHFGQSSVAIFFMITGLLFFSKILDAKNNPIDWTKLYVGRFFRLTPLYVTVISIFFLIVAVLSQWSLNESPLTVSKGAVRWLGFSLLGRPTINKIPETMEILAGVTWSLPYEWFFYLALPMIAFLLNQKVPKKYTVISLVSLVYLVIWGPKLIHLYAFLGGMLPAMLVRFDFFRRICANRFTSAFALALLCIVVFAFPSAYDATAIVILSCAFSLIAGGCSIFGLLLTTSSRLLGELTYGIYLIHGILLFVVFRFIIGFKTASEFSAAAYWGLIFILCPLLIVLCYATFWGIEKPSMKQTPYATAKIKSLWLRLTRVYDGGSS